MHKNIMVGTLILTVCGMLTKTIAFLFQLYFAGVLGSEGMGLYQLIFSVHGIMLTIASGGIGVAISKLAPESGQTRVHAIMRRAIGLVSGLSAVVIAVVLCSADFISLNFLKDAQTALGLKYLAPSVLFMSVAACVKSYFYSFRKILRPAGSEFLEQFVKITVTRFLISRWRHLGLDHACAAVMLGFTIGELCSCTYLYILYKLDVSKFFSNKKIDKDITKDILLISLPITAGAFVFSGFRMVEGVWIVDALIKLGADSTRAISELGVIRGMVMPMLLFPLMLLSSVVTMLIPEMARTQAKGSTLAISRAVNYVYRFTALCGMMMFGVFLAFADELGMLMYQNSDIGGIVRILSFMCPLMCFDMINSAVLGGLGEQLRLLKYGVMDGVLRLSLIWFVMPHLGYSALIFTIVLSNIFTAGLSMWRVLRVTRLTLDLSRHVVKPFFAAAVATVLVRIIYMSALKPHCGFKTGLFAGVFIMVGLYVLINAGLGNITAEDGRWIKKKFTI